MDGEEHPERVALRVARERTIERLGEAFAHDRLGLADFESRLDAAYRADGSDALARLVADLPEATSLARIEPRASTAIVAAPAAGPYRIRSIFGNVERGGRGALPRATEALAVFGNLELDLRDFSFPPGVTALHVRAVFGNVEIVVPPELVVECEGAGVFGSFSSLHRTPSEGVGDRPVLRILGAAVFGSVEIRTRPRGLALVAGR